MKKNHTGIITILILFFAITLISSCKEDKAKTAGDVDGPVLTVYKPDAADIYATGDTIYLSAHVEHGWFLVAIRIDSLPSGLQLYV